MQRDPPLVSIVTSDPTPSHEPRTPPPTPEVAEELAPHCAGLPADVPAPDAGAAGAAGAQPPSNGRAMAVVAALVIAMGVEGFFLTLLSTPYWATGAALGTLVGVMVLYKSVWRMPPRWLGVVGVAAFTVIGSAGGGYAKHLTSRHGLTEAEILAQAASDHLEPVRDQGVPNPLAVRLRPGNKPSEVFLFHPIDENTDESDQLRVYDPVGSRLKLAFRYQPRAEATPVDLVTSAALHELHPTKVDPYLIHLQPRPRDLDGTDGAELIFDLRQSVFGLRLWPRPSYLHWNARREVYEVVPLLSSASVGKRSPATVISRRYLQGRADVARVLIPYMYGTPNDISDRSGTAGLAAAYAVEAYTCNREQTNGPRGPSYSGIALTTGYVLREHALGFAERLQPVVWHIDLGSDPIHAVPETSPSDVIAVGRNVDRLAQLIRRRAPGGPPCYG